MGDNLKIDKVQFVSVLRTSRVSEDQIELLWNNYQKTGKLPEYFQSLLNVSSQDETSKPAKTNPDNTPVNTVFNNQSAQSAESTDFSFGLSIQKSSKPHTIATLDKHESTPTPQNITMTDTQAKDFTIKSLDTAVNSSMESFVNQAENEGIVSKGYNSAKEFVNSEMSKSSVTRELYTEQTGVMLMDKANKGDLTKQEYYDAKMKLLMDMMPNAQTMSAKDKAILENNFRTFAPEKLNGFIRTVATCSPDDYQTLGKRNQALIKQGSAPAQLLKDSSRNQLTINSKAKAACQISGAQEKMTFEETFLAERENVYKKENIEQFKNQEAQFSFVNAVQTKSEAIHSLLDSDIALVKGNNEGAVDKTTTNISNARLSTSLASAMKELYGDDSKKIDAKLKELSTNNLVSYENGKVQIGGLGKSMESYSLVSISEKLLAQTNTNCKKALGGKNVEEYQKDYANSYVKAYGDKNPKELAKAYSNDQEGFVQKVKMGVQVGGMIVAIAAPEAYAGIAALGATFGGTAVSALNESTRKNGMSPEALAGIKKELATNAEFLAVGLGAGALGTSAKAALLAKDCPNMVAFAGEYGVNALGALAGDLMINGEIDLKQETIGQAMILISSIVAHKKISNMMNNAKEEKVKTEVPTETLTPTTLRENNSVVMQDVAVKSSETINPFIQKSAIQVEMPKISPKAEAEAIIAHTSTKQTFSKKEIMEMKPTEFKKIMSERTDIDGKLTDLIDHPEKLKLYDELQELDAIKRLPEEKRSEFFERLMGKEKISEPKAQLEIIPGLIKKGYDPEFISKLPITEYNKNQVEYVLNQKELIDASVNSEIEKTITQTSGRLKKFGLTESEINEQIQKETAELKEKLPIKKIEKMLRYIDDNNAKYLDDCMKSTDDPSLLPYWKSDTKQIVEEFLHTTGKKLFSLDRLVRREHTYESVKKVAGGKPFDNNTERLLEFKNIEKYKDVDINNYKNLTAKEQKEFLNSFISSITPHDVNSWNSKTLTNDIDELGLRMKMFKELDTTSSETFAKSYSNTIRIMLDAIPSGERNLISQKINYGDFRANYRASNPIPPMVDDISHLPTEEVLIKGKKIKLAKLSKETELGIATHRIPSSDAILNIQALEITDPNEILCVGLKDGNRNLNFNDESYALVVKPRLENDWYLQTSSDFDSGTSSRKNIYTLDKWLLRSSGGHALRSVSYVQELVKKELNWSQVEYTTRLKALKGATTLAEVKKIDPVLEQAIRKVTKENQMYEGVVRPEVMGVCVSDKKPLSEISDDILKYCERNNVPLIQVTEAEIHSAIKKTVVETKANIEPEAIKAPITELPKPEVPVKTGAQKLADKLNISADKRVNIANFSQEIFDNTTAHFEEMKANFDNRFKHIEGVETPSRVKSQYGTKEKAYRILEKVADKKKDLLDKLSKATSEEQKERINIAIAEQDKLFEALTVEYSILLAKLTDSLGERVILHNPSTKNIDQVVDGIISGIESGEFRVLDLENYGADENHVYFNQEQIDRIKAACKKDNEKRGLQDEFRPENKYKPSGYTTTQLDLVYKNGVRCELQIRDAKVNEWSESEHILYDFAEGKDVAKGNKEIEALLTPIYDALKIKNADKKLKDDYEVYGKDCYRDAWDKATGTASEPLVLPEGIPKALEKANIIKTHEKLLEIQNRTKQN